MTVNGIIRAPVTDARTRFLSCRALWNLVNRMADRYGLPAVPEYLLKQQCYNETVSLPVILTNRCGTIWADRYYAAYRLKSGEFRYFYLTSLHIGEETYGYREAARLRGTPDLMPPEIRKCYRKALGEMRKNKASVWFDGEEIRVAA